MIKPLITGIVPVFNGERYLRETLDSMLVQTYNPLEIIVVDDGSTDGTAEVVKSYRDKVRYLHQDNSGPAIARNLGIESRKRGFYRLSRRRRSMASQKADAPDGAFRCPPGA